MNEEELSQQLNELKAKLNKAMRQIAGIQRKKIRFSKPNIRAQGPAKRA